MQRLCQLLRLKKFLIKKWITIDGLIFSIPDYYRGSWVQEIILLQIMLLLILIYNLLLDSIFKILKFFSSRFIILKIIQLIIYRFQRDIFRLYFLFFVLFYFCVNLKVFIRKLIENWSRTLRNLLKFHIIIYFRLVICWILMITRCL